MTPAMTQAMTQARTPAILPAAPRAASRDGLRAAPPPTARHGATRRAGPGRSSQRDRLTASA